MEQTAERRALESLLAPRQGTVTCRLDETVTLTVHGEPCLWRGTSVDSAARHTGAADVVEERARLGKDAPRGRAARHGHSFVGSAKRAELDRINTFVGTVRADSLVARIK